MTRSGSEGHARFGAVANVLGLVAAWLLVLVVFQFLIEAKFDRSFLTAANLETLARQSAIVSLAALGMTFVIVSGAIDLSVGSIVAFVTVVIAWTLHRGADPITALLAGVTAGALAGTVNGLLVTRLRVGAFIVTLGTLLVIRGAAKGLAGEQKIDAPATWLADVLAMLPPDRKWMLVPPGVWVAFLFAVLAALLLRATVFGRHVVATGGNELAAHYSGIPVAKVRLLVFTLGGFFAGLAGLMQFSRLTVGDPTVAVGLELDVIAAVVIGGASLSGGQGSIVGSLLGALLMTTIRAGCSQYGLANWVQEIVTGSIIVLAVALDRLRVGRARHSEAGLA
jgi:ribose/xylose/arabinose/galactoside ABC-type transport system permease subunit